MPARANSEPEPFLSFRITQSCFHFASLPVCGVSSHSPDDQFKAPQSEQEVVAYLLAPQSEQEATQLQLKYEVVSASSIEYSPRRNCCSIL